MQPSRRILILEDDDELRSLTVEALSEHGHWCRTASQPGHLTPADWRWADVAIVDLRLRDGGDGSSLLRQMLGVTPAPKLLLLSGYDAMVLHTTARAARDLGYDVLDALTKPISMNRLAGILGDIVDRTRAPPRTAPVAFGPEDLRRALDKGEITMVYPPKIHLASGTCIGVKALVRWHCPGKGDISAQRSSQAGRLLRAVSNNSN